MLIQALQTTVVNERQNVSGIVDWLTYTVYSSTEVDEEVSPIALINAFKPKFFPQVNGTAVKRVHSRMGMHWVEGFSMYVSVTNSVSVELSGKACQLLRERGVLSEILSDNAGRVTRLDLARDHRTDAGAIVIGRTYTNVKITSYSEVKSKSGETFYLGSRSGERYVRVYEYYKPHKRAGFVRTEYVLRKRYAQTAAMAIARGGQEALNGLINNLVGVYGFTHEDVQPLSESYAALKPPSVDRKTRKIAMWIATQVAPAVAKAIVSGDYTMQELIDEVEREIRDRAPLCL